MLKLLVYAKIEHMDSARIIADMQGIMTYLSMFVMVLLLLNVQYKDIVMNMVNIMSNH